MARVKIELPAAWQFEVEIPVRITDINYGRHVGNNTLLAYLQEARVAWLRSLGYPSELLAEPVGLILVDVAVRMKVEAAYGDRLAARLAVSEWTRVGFELVYQLIKTPSGEEVARASTGIVFFDYTARTLCAAPDGFRTRAGG